jgi:hypothetical protein
VVLTANQMGDEWPTNHAYILFNVEALPFNLKKNGINPILKKIGPETYTNA